MKKHHYSLSLPIITLFCFFSLVEAAWSTSAGLTLLETSGARPAALAEAFSTVPDDITGLSYNPGSLPTLEHPQASFYFRRGFEEQSYGQFLFGVPTNNYTYGVSVGYFNGGEIELFDGVGSRMVQGQRDLIVSLASGRRFGPLSIGASGKYISSQLIDSIKDSGVAGDIGAHYYLNHRFQIGAALQNFGTDLKFGEEGDPLPRLARFGTSYSFLPGLFATSLFLEGVTFLNESEFQPSVGIESQIGPLVLRGGYKHSSLSNEFSIGTGIFLNRMSIDYSLAMVEDIDVQHQFSLTQKFGGPSVDLLSYFWHPKSKVTTNEEIVTKKEPTISIKPAETYVTNSTPGQIYELREGDTWDSLAKRFYGSKNLGIKIQRANQHLSLGDLQPGVKIIIP